MCRKGFATQNRAFLPTYSLGFALHIPWSRGILHEKFDEKQIEQLQKYIDTKLEKESLLRDAQEKRQEERDRQRDAQLVEVIRGLQEIKAAQEKFLATSKVVFLVSKNAPF